MQKGRSFKFAWSVPFSHRCAKLKKQKNSTTIIIIIILLLALQRNVHIINECYFTVSTWSQKRVFVMVLSAIWCKKVICDSRVETPEPALLYSVCCFINSKQPVGIWPDFILCVCVTHFAKEGRRSVDKKKAHSERPEAACCKNRDISTSPVNGSARTPNESGWKSVPRIFACVIIDQPRLKGV